MQIKGGWRFWVWWHLTLARTGVRLHEAGFDFPTGVFVTCPSVSMCIYSSWFYTCCTDPALFLVSAPPKEMSLQTLGVLCGGSFCGVHCPCWQGRVVAQLHFVSALEAFRIH